VPSLAALLFQSLAAAIVTLATAASVAFAEPLVVCLGDSLTEGFGINPDKSYPSQLERLLAKRGWPNIEVVNAGISGSTSASGRNRLQWQLRRKPDLIVLALGANDGLRGVPLDATKKNLAGIIELAKTNNVTVLLAGMRLPPNYGVEYTSQFETMYADLADEHHVALLPFLLARVAARTELNLADGIHPNADGYAIVAETVAGHLAPLLERLAK
jgi:acyl-CoA thioesterase-1